MQLSELLWGEFLDYGIHTLNMGRRSFNTDSMTVTNLSALLLLCGQIVVTVDVQHCAVDLVLV